MISTPFVAPPELEGAILRLFRDFFDKAERKRRWRVADDINWNECNPKLDPAIADVVESFCAIELYLPDYIGKILPVVRSSKGRMWFYANWGYEESKHSLALGDWLLKSGHRTEEYMADLEKRVFENEWNLPQDSHLGMLAYAMVQEQVTFLNYRNLRERSRAMGGDPALEQMLGFISIDEAAHHRFFKEVFELFLKLDRESALSALRRVIDEFQMPAIHDLLDNSEKRISQIRGNWRCWRRHFLPRRRCSATHARPEHQQAGNSAIEATEKIAGDQPVTRSSQSIDPFSEHSFGGKSGKPHPAGMLAKQGARTRYNALWASPAIHGNNPMTPLESLVACGTKVWLDSVDPDEVSRNLAFGATGATSNPIIVSGIIETGRFDRELAEFMSGGLDDEAIAWKLTDTLVRRAQAAFEPSWTKTGGDDGYVSFELDPLLEDPERKLSVADRSKSYIELAKKWSAGHKNRMIKIPATDGGLAALEEVVAAGITVNVTLIFSERQYFAARDACWRGAQRRKSTDAFKSVYSIFVSRLDVYTEKHVPDLSPAAQGLVGIVNAKKIWTLNQQFWAGKGLKLKQEMIFASTGTKKPSDPAWKYVEAFAGSDIETNPPKTNADVQASGRTFKRLVDQMPPAEVVAEIEKKVDMAKLEEVLMREGLQKFADPQKALLALIAKKRAGR